MTSKAKGGERQETLSDADKRMIDFLIAQAIKQAVKTCT